ncbi:MAG TPA: penicillin-binding transpeptidase domain-containing protein [Candidatus Paceibacterota bacterium]|nr:penicillin-binding transpeptidase domain-containing protein [Candidatus Paceibacterota bacterium]
MMWRRKRRQDQEIAPDEIFLDASNAPAFDRARFEGRLEKPLPQGTFAALSGVLIFVALVLVARAWNLEITNGAVFAAESAHNSLEITTIFAPRGIITDRYGTVLAENVEKADGSVVRIYPIPSASSVIGYVSYPKKDANGVYYDTNETGVTGLEAEYNGILAGRNGQLLTETDALGRVRSAGSVIPAEEGGTLRLSIDANLEQLFAVALGDVADSQHFIAGAGVIMDVHTGAVRALVSFPSYDSNVMANGSPSGTIAGYEVSPGHPFINHAIQGVYAPGSIVKPFVASGALTDGLITPNTIIDDPGFLSIPDPYHPGKEFVYKGWKALGPVDVEKAIAWSSDIFFYTVGGGFGSQKGLGIDRLDYWYRQFGFGSTTGIDLPEEASGLVPTPAWKQDVFNEPWYLGDTYFTAIGQYAMQVTPIQMARATAAIANGGELFTPTLLEGTAPTFVTVPVNTALLTVIRAGMRDGVIGELAHAIDVPYLAVAAKTGTAQTGVHNQYDNSWVEGFFPYDHPQYAFAVVLERGPSGAGEQSVNVMRSLFDSLYSENSPYVGGIATSTSLAL